MVVTTLALWALMAVAGETPIGRFLHRWSVVIPAAKLDAVRPSHIAAIAMMLSVVAILLWAGGREVLAVLQMGAPEFTGWITTFEVATHLDIGVAIVISATTMRFALVRQVVRHSIVRRSARARSYRTRRSAKAANDDAEPEPRSLAA